MGSPEVHAEHWKVEFADYLRQTQARIYGYIHSLVPNVTDADDLMQQTTLILWKKFGEFDRQRSFFSWACGIARLEVTNFLRSRGRRQRHFSDEFNLMLIQAHEEMTDGELEDRREALSGCVEKLHERDRELIAECYGEDSGVHAAADRRGRSTQSIHNSLRRIRRTLFECITRTLGQQARPGARP
jgi:RNA polymerase sigma-70 factor, ECF subfamily